MQKKFVCSECGIEMKFDEESGMLSCSSCNRKEQVAGYEKDFLSYRHVKQLHTFEDEEARLYVCKSCGKQFITDNRTSLSKCFFCGGVMNPGDRISGDLCPTRILPFSITEKQAKKAFSRWFVKTKFAYREFRKRKREIKCHPMYLPVWMFQMRGQGEAMLHATNAKKTVEKEDNIKESIIKTEHFDLYRRFDLGFEHLIMSASAIISQRLLDALQPFDFSGCKVFDSHTDFRYAAEQYHFKDSDLEKKAEKKVQKSTKEYLFKTISGYQDVTLQEQEERIGKSGTEYLWLPIYFASFDVEDEDYFFVMNGQTGKVAFDPPYSVTKIIMTGGLLAVFVFLLIRFVIWMLGGALL